MKVFWLSGSITKTRKRWSRPVNSIFFSLASNYDLTLVPRYIEERGTVIGAEGRYLTKKFFGTVFISYLEKDRKFSKQTSQDTKDGQPIFSIVQNLVLVFHMN